MFGFLRQDRLKHSPSSLFHSTNAILAKPFEIGASSPLSSCGLVVALVEARGGGGGQNVFHPLLSNNAIIIEVFQQGLGPTSSLLQLLLILLLLFLSMANIRMIWLRRGIQNILGDNTRLKIGAKSFG